MMSLSKSIKPILTKSPFLLVFTICFLFVSCEYFKPYKVKNTAKDYLIDNVLHDKSYNIEVTKIVKDSFPYAINANAYDDVKEFNKAMATFFYSGLKNDKESLLKLSRVTQAMQSEIQSKCWDIEDPYVVYLKAYKNDKDNADLHIVLIDKEETDKVISHLNFDENFEEDLTNLFFVLTLPLEMDEDGVLDPMKLGRWYDNHIDECRDLSKRIAKTHKKRFKQS